MLKIVKYWITRLLYQAIHNTPGECFLTLYSGLQLNHQQVESQHHTKSCFSIIKQKMGTCEPVIGKKVFRNEEK